MLLTQRSGLIVGTLAHLLGYIFNWLYEAFKGTSYPIAISIILFTVIIRLLIYPLNLQSQRSSKIQRYLQPEFNKITKKYKGKKDQQSMLAQQKETRELQEKYGIKMTQGCLTSIIQMPIFFALYYIIQNIPAYVESIKDLYNPIATVISNNSDKVELLTNFVKENKIPLATRDVPDYDNLNSIIDVLCKCGGATWDKLIEIFPAVSQYTDNIDKIHNINSFILGINLTEAPGFKLSWALIIPILSGLFQFLSMKVMPQPTVSDDPQQQQSQQMMKSMNYMMPLMSVFITFSVPTGVGLYWATGAFVSFITTVCTNFYYDHCDMEKLVERQAAKAAKKIAKKKASGKKSFMDKLAEAAGAQPDQNEAPKNMDKIASTKLKNYSSATSVSTSDKKVESANPNNVKYKAGSLAAKANLLNQYNEKGGKE